jgi:DNA invertase Pin-like site-specific DNA recombinase
MHRTVATYHLVGDREADQLRLFALNQGWQIIAELKDNPAGPSGRQPGFVRLLKLLSAGKADIVLAPTLLDLGSGIDDLLALAVAIKSGRSTLHVLDDEIDTGPESAWLATMVTLDAYRTQKRRAAIRAGQKRAQAAGVTFGRPRVPQSKIDRVRAALAAGGGPRPISRTTGVSASRVALECRRMREAGLLPAAAGADSSSP